MFKTFDFYTHSFIFSSNQPINTQNSRNKISKIELLFDKDNFQEQAQITDDILQVVDQR